MQELKVEGLVKMFPGRENVVAVDHVDIEVMAGEMLVLLGPSGCGKTTLLRCVAGLEMAEQGRIALEGKDVFDASIRLNEPTHLRDIGMVFQNYSLWPHMTVRDNVGYPLKARGVAAGERERRIKEALEVVQCTHLQDRIPSMLSGGQQQRIALARALAPKPKIMLLDEPLSNLDALLRIELRAHLRAIHREVGFTGIYVTHDQVEAFNLGTRVAVMRAGRIEQLASAREVYQRPATEYVARFLGIRNTLALECKGGWVANAGPLDGDLSILEGCKGPLQMYIRPQDVRVAGPEEVGYAAGRLSLSGGRVVDALYSGGEIDYLIDVGGVAFYVSTPVGEVHFDPGDAVALSFMHRNTLFYENQQLVLPTGKGSFQSDRQPRPADLQPAAL